MNTIKIGGFEIEIDNSIVIITPDEGNSLMTSSYVLEDLIEQFYQEQI